MSMTYPAALIDLHCDTLTATHGGENSHTLDDPRSVLALSRLPKGVNWCQCFAVFVPDGLTPAEGNAYYRRFQASFVRQLSVRADAAQCRTAEDIRRAWAEGKTAAILTVENGAALGGNLAEIDRLARDGVGMLTLTWNGENPLGSGHATDHGLSPLGRVAVPRLEEAGILIDVSHLNDPGFYQLLDLVHPLSPGGRPARAWRPDAAHRPLPGPGGGKLPGPGQRLRRRRSAPVPKLPHQSRRIVRRAGGALWNCAVRPAVLWEHDAVL